MIQVKEHNSKKWVMIYRILLIIAAVLILVLIIGTIYGLLKRDNTDSAPPAHGISDDENIFSGIGTLRIPTADPEPETLIINIAFPYNRNDRAFFEELASRLSWFRTTTQQYLGALSAEELSLLDVETINQELLNRFNAALRLGQIRELYILEYMQL